MGKKKTVKKGKKPHKNKPTSKKYTKYKIEGDKVTRAKTCPRCGPGIFLLDSQGRIYCGKCHYAEFQGKASKDVPSKEIKEGKKIEESAPKGVPPIDEAGGKETKEGKEAKEVPSEELKEGKENSVEKKE